ITDGMEINGVIIYLCPVDAITTIESRKFGVRPARQAPGKGAGIDSFLVSVAEETAGQSIGVILSGTDGDGTLGVAALKAHGGLAIAERLPHAGPDHLTAGN